MHGDEPTIPNLRMYGADEPGDAPNWPVVGRRPPPSGAPNQDLRTAMLGASLGANVVLLIGLVGVLLLARAGFFSPSGASPLSSPTVSASTQARGTAGPEQSTPTPRAVSDWLQVTPSTVSLGCASGQQTQFVVLANQGPEQVEWRADLSGSEDRAAISISPDHGQLRSGASIALRVQNRSHDNVQQGTIRFEVSPDDAGSPPSINYTAQGCG